jgi:transcriptional regulator with XRE-family HTH domain
VHKLAATYGRVMPRRDHHALTGHLRHARLNAGWTQHDVAIALGIPIPTLSQIERGYRKIDLLEACAYLTVIGVAFVNFVAYVRYQVSSSGDD